MLASVPPPPMAKHIKTPQSTTAWNPDSAPSHCSKQLLNNIQGQGGAQSDSQCVAISKIFCLQALEERGGHQESREAEVDGKHEV